MSDELFKLLLDSASAPKEKLQVLASEARRSQNLSYVEIRLDGIGEVRFGDPQDDVCRMAIGSAARPLGEMLAAPVPPDGLFSALVPFARCAELIHRLQAGYMDALTGLYNRRRLDIEFGAIQLSGDPVAVAMLDIDHFKRVNDTFGHDAGDAVLREFSSRLAARAPSDGFLARYGGEEFCLILKNMNLQEAADVVESVRSSISSTPVSYKEKDITVTSSAGIAAGPGREAPELLERADQALYSAKESGRNQSVRADEILRRGVASLFRRKFRKLFPRPLLDLSWFGQRVVGIDPETRRLMAVDYFGGVVPFSRELPDAISFVRAADRTFWVPANSRGLNVWTSGRAAAPAPSNGEFREWPEFRKVIFDARMKRLFFISRAGDEVYSSDFELRKLRKIPLPDSPDEVAGVMTAVLPVGRGVLILDAIRRKIFVLDRNTFAFRRSWNLPDHDFEICLSYIHDLKLILAGGPDGSKFLTFSGELAEHMDIPVISAYAHPLVGLVLATPDETILVK